MTLEIAIVLGILLFMFVLFMTEAFPLDVTALITLAVFLILGYLEPAEAVKGFSNPAVVTIAILFALSYALQKSGILEFLVVKLNEISDSSKTFGLAVFLFSVAIASAFINNTAIVAVFIPVTIRLARRYHLSPSKLLIPLSYVAILGGTLTLVGTSTNLLVNSIYIETISGPPLGIFEFAKFGIIILIIGIIYILFVGPLLIPSRTVTTSLTQSYHMGGYLTELKISSGSPLIGKTCQERSVNRNYDITVLDILRGGELISRDIRNTVLKENDILFVRGSLESFLRMKEVEKVKMLTDEKLTQSELVHDDNILVECILTNQSELIGKSLMESNFRRRFGSFILAVRREGAILRRKIAHIILRAFDTLLVYGSKDKLKELSNSGHFIVVGEIDASLKKHRFWWMSTIIIFLIVVLASMGLIPILKGAIIGLVILMVFKVLTANEVYQSINWQVITLIAALIPIGFVIQSSGTALWIGSGLFSIVDYINNPSLSPFLMLSLVYLVTMAMTELSSNAATAVIMTPVAISAAAQLGLDPRPFIFAVCYAASASFITPIGYQTNLMVYGPGGYKFSDYVRVGLPLSITFWLIASFVIPILWPFESIG